MLLVQGPILKTIGLLEDSLSIRVWHPRQGVFLHPRHFCVW